MRPRFEPANAGWALPPELRLGSRLSRHIRKRKAHLIKCWLKTIYAASRTQQGNILIPYFKGIEKCAQNAASELDIFVFKKYTALVERHTIRSFFAIDIPDQQKKAILSLSQQIDQKLAGQIRWVNSDQIHGTLKFIANLQTNHLDPIYQDLSKQLSDFHPLQLAIKGFGIFPSFSSPRVLWVGLDYPPDLNPLHEILENTAGKFGYTKEGGPFSPHVTIGRVRKNLARREFSEIGVKLRTVRFDSLENFTIDHISLYQSVLKAGGPIYKNLFSIPLGQ